MCSFTLGLKMAQTELTGLEKRLANLRPCKPGQNRHTTKRERIAAKLNELVAEYFPNGGYSVMDANRLKLAAQHYFTAETSQDAIVAQRATRIAEYLLTKLSKPSQVPCPPAATDFEKSMWADLLEGNKPKP
jgi:hypothetical protein